jgi:hypothetical protein
MVYKIKIAYFGFDWGYGHNEKNYLINNKEEEQRFFGIGFKVHEYDFIQNGKKWN